VSGVAFGGGLFGAFSSVTVWAAFGADLTAPSSTWNFTDITSPVMYSGPVNITPMGRSDETSQAQPAACTFTIFNESGDFTEGNPTSQYWPYVRQGTPIKIELSIDGVSGYTRFFGYVNGWTPADNITGDFSTVTVSASGITRRMGQGTSPSVSPIFRSTLKARPKMYAPMEETVGATTIAVLNADGTTIDDAVFGPNADPGVGDTTLLGSKTPAKLLATSYLNMNPELSPTTSKFNGHWQIDWFMFFPSEPAAETIIMRAYTDSSTVLTVDAVYGGGVYGIRAYGPGGSVAGSAIFAVPTFGVPNQWTHWRLMGHAASGGVDVDYQVVTFPINGAGSFAPLTVASATVGNNRGAGILPQAGLAGVSMCHWAIYDRYNYSAVDASADAYDGETATDRIERTCLEEGIELTLTGSSAVTMGPQPVGTVLAILRECEKADGGVLHDGRTAGLSYVAHSARYNLNAAVTLDATAGQVGGALPTFSDDQRRRNKASISRQGGGTGTFEQIDGPLGTATIGLYDTSETWNVSTDGQLQDLAAWVVHLGQVEGFRYPNFALDLLATTQITGATTTAAGWLTVEVAQGRLDVTNIRDVAPSRPPGDIRLLVEGWSETIDPLHWTVSGNCSAYDPWEVGTLDNDGYLDCGASVTVSTMTTGSTSVDVAVSDGCNWAHTSGDFMVTIDGEVRNVTAVGALTAATPTFGAAGTAAHADGHTTRTVQPGLPASLATGNLMLIVASCRDTNDDPNIYLSGTSIIGWEKLIEARNFCVFGKVATASETAPTVNIDSTIFGDTLQAVMVRLAGKFGDPLSQLVAAESLLNGSAQNINYPALSVELSSCMIFWVGWKGDDCSGVGTIPGAAEAFEATTTDGNDSTIVMDYQYSAAATSVASGSFTVTGGATAISRGAVFAIRTAYQTLTIQRAQRDTVAVASAVGKAVNVTDPLIWARE
jgi:hypothetical protein